MACSFVGVSHFFVYCTKQINNKHMEKLSLEECKAIYFDEDALQLPEYQLFRINNHGGGRFYYREVNGEIKFYISVTNMIKSTMPTGQGLIKWIADMGIEEAEAYAEERAHYGTFMHTKFTELLLDRKLGMVQLANDLDLYIELQKVNPALRNQWLDDMKKDLLSFANFLHTHKVKALAVEVVLCDDEDETAGAVDLVCKMEIEEEGYHGEVYKTSRAGYYDKGDPKLSKAWVPIVAVVDYKSGKKGFYEEHEIQLAEYKKFVEKNFGIKVDKLYNFAPADWKTTPSFKLKDQTNSPNIEKLPYLIEIAKIEKRKRVMKITQIDIDIDLDAMTDEVGVEQFFNTIELADFITKMKESNDRPN